MGLLDAVSGAMSPLSMMPGGDILSVVSKGLDLIKGLIDGKDMQGADKALDILSKLMEGATNSASSAAASEPQPFSAPPNQGAGSGSGQSMKIEIDMPRPAQMLSHPPLPEVDGSAQGDRNLSDAARPNIEGSDANVNRTLSPGSNEWTTVMWAMQKNPNICYDADSQRFFTKMSDGSKRDVCSLQDAENVIQQNGGFNRSNPVAAGALDQFLSDKVGQSQNSPLSTSISFDLSQAGNVSMSSGFSPASGSGSASEGPSMDELNAKIDALKKQLVAFEQAQQLMNAGSNNSFTVTVTT